MKNYLRIFIYSFKKLKTKTKILRTGAKKSVKIGTKILFNKKLFEFAQTSKNFDKVSGKNVSKSEKFLTIFYKIRISSKK